MKIVGIDHKKCGIVIECGCGTRYTSCRTKHEVRCPGCKKHALMSSLIGRFIGERKATELVAAMEG
jgi:hypothetical protein